MNSSSPSLSANLADARITGLPPSVYYIPDFVTSAEEACILSKINSAPLPRWKNLSHRRLQAYPSPLSPSNTLLASPLPSWLYHPIIPRLLSLPLSPSSSENVFSASPHHTPNHVLINEYLPGQGILPHEDGAAYYPVVATVSLGAPIVLDFYAKGNAEVKWRFLQENRSLLITTEALYTEFLHGIQDLDTDKGLVDGGVVNWDLIGEKEIFETGSMDRGTRVSLTFRDVVKVKKLGKGLSFGAK